MPIKIAFSSSVCPAWDIHQIAEQANEIGFHGVELGTVRDELHLPAAEDLQDDKDIDAVRKLFDSSGVEIVGLTSKYSVEAAVAHLQRRSVERNIENIELAGKLGCQFVRVPVGKAHDGESMESTLARTIDPLRELAQIAAKNNVTLLMCNTPGFPSSRAVWFAVDGVSHPSVQAAWNPVLGLAVKEECTIAIPRLGARNKITVMADASFDSRGAFLGYKPLGDGDIDVAKHVDLLKGVLFDGYLMMDWPKARLDDFPEPADALPAALAIVVERIKHQEEELTAYKKDKNAANWSKAKPSFVERKVAKAAEEEGAVAVAEDGDKPADDGKPRMAKGGDPRIAKLVAEAVAKVRAARAAGGG